MHRKDIADEDGSAVSGMIKESFKDNYRLGTQNLLRHLAQKYPTPRVERRTQYFGHRGLYATTDYIYMYMVENAMAYDVVAIHAGYVSSSKDHYYLSRGATEKALRFGHRNRKCGCEPCLDLTFENCLLTRARTDLCAGTTP